jgi:hypothetical protein
MISSRHIKAFALLIVSVLTITGITSCGTTEVTYDNNKYGFMFKYPSGWKIQKENAESAGWVTAVSMKYEGKEGFGYLDVRVFDLPDTSLIQFAELRKKDISEIGGKNLKVSTTTLGGAPAIQLTYDVLDKASGSEDKHFDIATVKNGKIYSLEYSIDAKDYSEASDPFPSIIESFKFK